MRRTKTISNERIMSIAERTILWGFGIILGVLIRTPSYLPIFLAKPHFWVCVPLLGVISSYLWDEN